MILRDPMFITSLSTLTLSLAAWWFGVPLADPQFADATHQVVTGVMGASSAVMAVRALKPRAK